MSVIGDRNIFQESEALKLLATARTLRGVYERLDIHDHNTLIDFLMQIETALSNDLKDMPIIIAAKHLYRSNHALGEKKIEWIKQLRGETSIPLEAAKEAVEAAMVELGL